MGETGIKIETDKRGKWRFTLGDADGKALAVGLRAYDSIAEAEADAHSVQAGERFKGQRERLEKEHKHLTRARDQALSEMHRLEAIAAMQRRQIASLPVWRGLAIASLVALALMLVAWACDGVEH